MNFNEELLKEVEEMIWIQAAIKCGSNDPFDRESREESISKNKEIREKAENFIKTYRDWFDFHKRIDKLGKNGNMNNKEKEKLESLIQKKEDARKTYCEILK